MYGHYQLPAINRHIYHNWRPPRCRTLAAVKSASSLRWRQLWCHKANSLLLVNKPRKSRFDNFLSDREAESVKDHCARLVLFYFSVKWLFADSRAHALCAHDQIAHCATWESIRQSSEASLYSCLKLLHTVVSCLRSGVGYLRYTGLGARFSKVPTYRSICHAQLNLSLHSCLVSNLFGRRRFVFVNAAY